MAYEESHHELGFLSDTDIEDIFDREKVFSDELESQTIARVDWLETKHRAAFLAFVLELGIDPDTAAKLSHGQVFLARQFGDFVSIGIDADHILPPIKHPLDEALNDVVSHITEPHGMGEAIKALGPVSALMIEVLYSSDEELLHRLERFRPHSED